MGRGGEVGGGEWGGGEWGGGDSSDPKPRADSEL